MLDVPPVSVVMAVYNSAKVVAEAIESILHQTLTDFELILVDDGSTDGTGEILREYARQDPRIELYVQENCGLIASLNRYGRLAKGRYIARMDADDISLPSRLEKQFRFLEAHPEIGVLGTWIQDIDENRVLGTTWPVPTDSAILRWFLMFGNCMAHSSVMMRRAVLECAGYYRSGALHVEDYDLWIRASEITGLANLPEVLVHYRISGHSVSDKNLFLQDQLATDLKCALIGSLLRHDVRRDAINALQQSAAGVPVRDRVAAMDAANLLPELYQAYAGKVQLTRDETAEIAADVVRRLSLLAWFAKTLRIWFRSFQFVPSLLTLRTVKTTFSLTAWVLRYRGRVFISQRRRNF
jgi:glycosyltransferase involved in cell wall biosynthesis